MKLLHLHDEQNSEHHWKQKFNESSKGMYVIGNIRNKLGGGGGGGNMVPLNPYHSKVGIETSHPILRKPNDCPNPLCSVEHIGTHCDDF